MIEQMYKEDEYKIKPKLDEQELIEINNNLHYAIHQDLEVEITFFANHDTHKIQSKIYSIDMVTNYITLNNEDRTKIKTEDILRIDLN